MSYFEHNKINFNYSHISNKNYPNIFSDKLNDLFKKDIENNDPVIFKKNFASSVQKIYELYFGKILQNIYSNEFSNNLVFAGGCALNSSANNFLISEKFNKNIFIPFAPGDNGGSLGAAFYIDKKINENNFNNPYIGTSYSDDEVEKVLDRFMLINYF